MFGFATRDASTTERTPSLVRIADTASAQVVLLAVVLLATFAKPPCCNAGCVLSEAKSCVCCETPTQSTPCHCCNLATHDCVAPLEQFEELDGAARYDRCTEHSLATPRDVATKDTAQTSRHATMTALDYCVLLSRLTL